MQQDDQNAIIFHSVDEPDVVNIRPALYDMNLALFFQDEFLSLCTKMGKVVTSPPGAQWKLDFWGLKT